MEKNIVIIYDFDGTFYSGEKVFSKIKEKVDANKRSFLPNISDSDYETICKENPLWLEKSTGADIVDLLYLFNEKYPSLDISVDAFNEWQENDKYEIVLTGAHLVSPRFIEWICSLYPVYIVSNSSNSHLNRYLKTLGMDRDWFEDVISNKFIKEDRTKKHIYKSIMEKENVSASEVYVFGDSKRSDLEPAKALNMNTFFVSDAYDLEEITIDATDSKK